MQSQSHPMDLPTNPISQQQQQIQFDSPQQIIWRRNAPYFYQMLYTNELQWPSLTVEWKPDPQLNQNRRNNTDNQFISFLTYGTNTSCLEQNYIVFGKVRVPNQEYLHKKYKERPLNKSDAVKKNDGAVQSKIQIMYEVQHPGQVNRIRRNPKQTNLLASRTVSGDILIIDEFKLKRGKNPLKPLAILKGHQGEGFAISWNHIKENFLAAGSYNGKLSVWDTVQKKDDGFIYPLCDFHFHQKQIEDVSFNHFHDAVFASCDDAGYTAFWDMRSSNKPIHTMQNHQGTIYSLQFSPLNEYLWASGGSDTIAKVWDVRNPSQPLFNWKTDNEQISNLRWSSDDRTTLWTCNNKLMTLWDICEGKSKYVHGGHLKRINQMAVHPNLTDVFASVDEDHAIHVFQPNRNYK